MSRNYNQITETIFAPATPPGRGGVSVIRISGSRSQEILEKLTRKPCPDSHHACVRKLYNASSELLDEALVLFFRGPKSFTGEDVVELHLHGGHAVSNSLCQTLLQDHSIRLAEPGEFSKRAFLNQKLDLTEVEAIADLVNAQTFMQQKQALRQMSGELGNLYHEWHDQLKRVLAYAEAYIDFSDEDIPDSLHDLVQQQINALIGSFREHLDDHHVGERIREGFYITILGPPNAGKSSLLNLLSRRDVAIVTDIAGTTRDILEVQLDLAGYSVTIADTAGLRETQDQVEQIGIERAKKHAQASDFKIILIQAQNLTLFLEDLKSLDSHIDEGSLLLINKVDLVNDALIQSIAAHLEQNFGTPYLMISCNTQHHIDQVIAYMISYLQDHYAMPESISLTRQRHRYHLENSYAALLRSQSTHLPELLCEDLRIAMRSLGMITGFVDVEDLLDVIFRDFCIGK